MMNSKSDTSSSDAPAPPQRRPRFALFIATACGLGYLPKAPGTWGSLGGIFLTLFPAGCLLLAALFSGGISYFSPQSMDPFFVIHCLILAATACVGVWTAGKAANYFGQVDPQKVVIDEVSGQHLALVLGTILPTLKASAQIPWYEGGSTLGPLFMNWKYLLLGFILFRAFDIWKPFPARQAESLPGGWGIMADDWIAGIYAAIGLWIARSLGL
ncbi:MAG: phosphatidylglycerophosphatase A [Candidatus Acidiferrales bacterium]